MNSDYDGVKVIDSDGESIGKVQRTYVDDSNTPRYVEVKIGALLPKHRLIPAPEADVTDDGSLRVAYSKDVIEGSPAAPDSDTLEPSDLERIDSYYAGIGAQESASAQPAPSSSQAAGDPGSDEQSQSPRNQFEVVDESAGGLQVGDQVPAGMEAPIVERGDVVEVPVLQEVLAKKTIVKEILRVKKNEVVEQESVEGDVRRETLEVDDPSGSVADAGVDTTSR